jgi:chromosomal replication initiator protein
LTPLSFADVGRLFGNRDHTTVLHACRKVETQLENDESLRRLVDDLTQQIGAEGLV